MNQKQRVALKTSLSPPPWDAVFWNFVSVCFLFSSFFLFLLSSFSSCYSWYTILWYRKLLWMLTSKYWTTVSKGHTELDHWAPGQIFNNPSIHNSVLSKFIYRHLFNTCCWFINIELTINSYIYICWNLLSIYFSTNHSTTFILMHIRPHLNMEFTQSN